jgi:hypothetical protein
MGLAEGAWVEGPPQHRHRRPGRSWSTLRVPFVVVSRTVQIVSLWAAELVFFVPVGRSWRGSRPPLDRTRRRGRCSLSWRVVDSGATGCPQGAGAAARALAGRALGHACPPAPICRSSARRVAEPGWGTGLRAPEEPCDGGDHEAPARGTAIAVPERDSRSVTH